MGYRTAPMCPGAGRRGALRRPMRVAFGSEENRGFDHTDARVVLAPASDPVAPPLTGRRRPGGDAAHARRDAFKARRIADEAIEIGIGPRREGRHVRDVERLVREAGARGGRVAQSRKFSYWSG